MTGTVIAIVKLSPRRFLAIEVPAHTAAYNWSSLGCPSSTLDPKPGYSAIDATIIAGPAVRHVIERAIWEHERQQGRLRTHVDFKREHAND